MVKEAALEIESMQFALEQGRMYLLGRVEAEQAEVDIALQCESLDNKHCIIEMCMDAVYVIDLHSKSGTYLNGVRLSAMQKVRANGEAKLRVGSAEGLLRVVANEKSLDSSGFHEELKNTTSSPAQKMLTPHIDDNKNFLVPTVSPLKRESLLTSSRTSLNKSLNTSTAANSTTDSFNIPETQHCRSHSSLGNDSLVASDKSCFDVNADIDDSFIPETQQPVINNSKNQLLGSSPNDDATVEANMPMCSTSNQFFRMCTQEFNEDLFGEEVDMESRDLLGCLKSSPLIPKIQTEPVLIGKPQQFGNDGVVNVKTKIRGEEAEMAALNWSAATTKCDTLNETAKSSDIEARDDACTPDLFDLPELAAPDNLLGDQEPALPVQAVPTAELTTINQATSEDEVATSSVDACDLLPTQVFTVRAQKKVSPPQAEAADTELSLSGKENVLPTAVTDMTSDLAETQVFVCNEDGKPESRHTSSTNTEVFSLSCVKSNRSLINVNTILIGADDKQSGSAASFLKDKEKIPQKSALRAELKSELEHSPFPKPTSTKSGVSTSTNFLAETEVNMDVCTPQWIKDQFEILSQEQNITANKQRRIDFGADSDEEIDELNLLGAEKVSNDFDRLLSHVKDASTHSTPASDGKARNNSAIVNVDISKNVRKMERSEKQKKKEKKEKKHNSTSNKTQNFQSTSKEERQVEPVGRTRPSHKTSTITSSDSTKEEKRSSTSNKTQNSRTATKKQEHVEPARRSTRLKSHTEEPKEEKNKRAGNEKKQQRVTTAEIKTEKEVRRGRREYKTEKAIDINGTRNEVKKEEEKPIPQRRRNTKKSESDQSQSTTAEPAKSTESEEQESLQNVATRRQTRARSKTESQESTTSSTSVTTNTKNERKRKVSVPVKEGEPKRLRSASIASTPPATTRKLQVSMTMVDPELFQKLAQHAEGIWTIAKDPADSDVLIMDKGNRTLKFLIAMAKGIPIVTSKWLEYINQTKRVPKGTEYLFVDADFENRHKFSLLKSLDLARKQKIFDGYEFLVTPSIMPQPSDMREIIKCAGGTLHTDIPAPKQDQKLYLISTPKDTKLWHKYRRSNNNIRIISSEGVMASIMRQKLKPLDMHLLS